MVVARAARALAQRVAPSFLNQICGLPARTQTHLKYSIADR